MKLAVIVGAGRGMGNNIAERFAKENFRVVLVARRQNLLDEYADELSSKGYEVFTHAAFMQGGRASEISAAEAVEHFKVDVAGAIHCVQQVLPKQIARGDGAIIFTGGLFGVYPNANVDFACVGSNVERRTQNQGNFRRRRANYGRRRQQRTFRAEKHCRGLLATLRREEFFRVHFRLRC